MTILTGFLGSGKSTLVRHILTLPDHRRRIAVVENKFDGGGGYGRGSSRLAAVAMATIESLMQQLERINPTAPARMTTFSRVDDLGWILDSDCFDTDRARDIEATFERLLSLTTKINDNNDEASGRPRTNMYCMGNHCRPPPRDFDPSFCGLCGHPVPTMIAAIYVICTPRRSARSPFLGPGPSSSATSIPGCH